MGKNLSDMTKELEAIAAMGSVSDLPEKLTEAEEAKVEVENMILERVRFLLKTWDLVIYFCLIVECAFIRG